MAHGPDAHGLVTERTDRTQALIGLGRAHRAAVKNLAADVRNDFAALILAAIEDRPHDVVSRARRSAVATPSHV